MKKNLLNVHPGELLREEFLMPLGITAYRLAKGARLPHQHLWGWHQHDAPVARWIDAFLGRWVKGADAGMVAAE